MKKVIVISGGTDGLGKSIAQTLSPKHTVVILSPHEDKLKNVSSELSCDYVICDVSSYSSCLEACNIIIKKYTRIDCLINNAGIWIEGDLESNDPDKIQEVVNTNTLGVIFLTKAVIQFMKKESKGLIINIISQAGLYAKSQRSIYTATKWAISGFTKCMQPELAQYGISVTGMYPGKMNTRMFEKMGIHKDMHDSLEPDDVARTIEFILTFDTNTNFPEIGIKNVHN